MYGCEHLTHHTTAHYQPNPTQQEGEPLKTEGIPAGTVLKGLEARVFNQMGEEVGSAGGGLIV